MCAKLFFGFPFTINSQQFADFIKKKKKKNEWIFSQFRCKYEKMICHRWIIANYFFFFKIIYICAAILCEFLIYFNEFEKNCTYNFHAEFSTRLQNKQISSFFFSLPISISISMVLILLAILVLLYYFILKIPEIK